MYKKYDKIDVDSKFCLEGVIHYFIHRNFLLLSYNIQKYIYSINNFSASETNNISSRVVYVRTTYTYIKTAAIQKQKRIKWYFILNFFNFISFINK